MELSFKPLAIMYLAAGLTVAGCAKKHVSLWQSLSNPDDVRQLKSFVAEKTAQANSATTEPFPWYAQFLAAASAGDWQTASNLDEQARSLGGTNAWAHGTRWEIMKEISASMDAFGAGDEKYVDQYANAIISSIPPGSIYFGGTDPGRFLITAMQKSQAKGDPFFTLTQNQLADGAYLDYLRHMYGDRLYIPTVEDSRNCFNDYYADVQRRMRSNQLKPGEDVSISPDGRMQISGQVAVMGVNALLIKVIFDNNTNHDIYVEESYPLDWMYPYLEPHGLIFKLNHASLDKLSNETVEANQGYWAKTIKPMIGDWLTDDTSVADVAAFGQKVYLHHDFSGFTGDTNFVLDSYSHRAFSKLRSSIAGLYAWRVKNSDDPAEKARMAKAADLAFRQALALCPYSPEAVFRYAEFLADLDRIQDALTVAEAGKNFDSSTQFDSLITSLKQREKQ